MKHDPEVNVYFAESHFDFIGWDILKVDPIASLSKGPRNVKVLIRRRRPYKEHFQPRAGGIHWVTYKPRQRPEIRTVISSEIFVPTYIYYFYPIPRINQDGDQ